MLEKTRRGPIGLNKVIDEIGRIVGRATRIGDAKKIKRDVKGVEAEDEMKNPAERTVTERIEDVMTATRTTTALHKETKVTGAAKIAIVTTATGIGMKDVTGIGTVIAVGIRRLGIGRKGIGARNY